MIFPLPESYGWSLDVPVADEQTARQMRARYGREVFACLLRLGQALEEGEEMDERLVQLMNDAAACRGEWDPS